MKSLNVSFVCMQLIVCWKMSDVKVAAIFGETNIFRKLGSLLCRDTLSIKNFVKIALSRTVFKIQAFLCFAIFVKNSKIQNGHHFWQDKHFLTFW